MNEQPFTLSFRFTLSSLLKNKVKNLLSGFFLLSGHPSRPKRATGMPRTFLSEG